MTKQIEQFIREFSHISIADMEELFEYFQDKGFLSKKGLEFRHKFWKLFIKE